MQKRIRTKDVSSPFKGTSKRFQNFESFINGGYLTSGILTKARTALQRHKDARGSNDAPSWDGRREEIRNQHIEGYDINTDPLPITSMYGKNVLADLIIYDPENGKNFIAFKDVIINLSCKKEIVKTSLTGFKGTIKEYVTQGDYDITFNIGLYTLSETHIFDEYPSGALTELLDYLRLETSLKIYSSFLTFFDIQQIVVTNYTVNQTTHSSRQSITVTALSDTTYQILYTDQQPNIY